MQQGISPILEVLLGWLQWEIQVLPEFCIILHHQVAILHLEVGLKMGDT